MTVGSRKICLLGVPLFTLEVSRRFSPVSFFPFLSTHLLGQPHSQSASGSGDVELSKFAGPLVITYIDMSKLAIMSSFLYLFLYTDTSHAINEKRGKLSIVPCSITQSYL